MIPPLKNKTIVIFSNMRFDSPIEATSFFLAKSFAKENQVFYVEYPSTIKDYYTNKDSPAFLNMKQSFFNASMALLDTDVPNLKKLIPPIIAPINFLPEGKIFRFFLKMNEHLVIKRIKTVLKARGIKDFVYINSFNFHYPGIGKALKPLLNIYQCVDPMIVPYDMKHGVTSELQLVEESDMVICTSKALYEEKSKINKHTYFVPNAADLSHSSKALDEDMPVHPILEKIPKPIIGYFGSIERRMDFDLLQAVINKNTDKSFVFIGPSYAEHLPERFLNTPNLYVPGAVPYDDMPQILKGFDIAIIPFKKDEVSATIFPLKLFEYLGAGKPVAITDFNPDLKEYTYGAVSFCSDADEFDKAINDILKNDTPEKQAERIAVAQKNTWDIRAEEIGVLIEKGLAQKAKQA
jgi:teichuronic acid biosynthesis glycosyltransferase TuaH